MTIFRHGAAVFFGLAFLAAASGCSGGEKFEKKEIAIEGRAGRVVIGAELARTPAQQRQGYMHRKNLEDGEGMLFIYEKDEILSFWMKNTLVPLSIAFIAYDGKILEIFDMEPGNLAPVHSSRSARYALEVKQGWFSRAGLAPGDRLILEGL